MGYPKPRILSVDGRVIRIAHPDTPGQPKSHLTAAVAALGTTLTVQDNTGFVNSEYTRIGVLGSDRTEIVRNNSAVTRGTSLTTTACVFPHATGTEVERMIFDQWRIYGNSTNSSSGATLVATIDIKVDAPYTTYVNSSTEYAYYFAIGYDSNAASLSDVYSDGVSSTTSYSLNTVGSLIESSLDGVKGKRTTIMTDLWFFREINDCLRYITGKLKTWSYLQSFDQTLGQTTRGSFSFTMPTDIEDVNSPKSVLSVHLGGKSPLLYKDKREFEYEMAGSIRTTVRTTATSGQTTLEITNSYDFPDAGTATVYVSGTRYDITYTGVTRSTTAGVLTGVPASGTGSISVTIASGLNIWNAPQEGEPSFWGVWDGSAYIWPMADANYDNLNLYMDYYTTRTVVNSAGDAIEGPRYDAVKHWLIAKCRAQSNSTGKLDLQDPDWQLFNGILGDLIRTEVGGQRHKMKPRVNSISY